jgi:hypothetical protein
MLCVSRIGRKVEQILQNVEVSLLERAPCTVLFPASHGFGLGFTLLLQFLVEGHNTAVNVYKQEVGRARAAVVGAAEVVDVSMLAVVDVRDLQLALVANTEFELNVGTGGGATQAGNWKLNAQALEEQVMDM